MLTDKQVSYLMLSYKHMPDWQKEFFHFPVSRHYYLCELQCDLSDPAVLDLLTEMMFDPVARRFAEAAFVKCSDDQETDPHLLWVLLDQIERRQVDTNVYAWDELASQEDEEITWLVDGVFATHSTSILSGIPKVGKSSLIRWLIYCLTTGHPFLNHTVPQPANVVYLCLEDPAFVLRHSLRKLYSSDSAVPRRGNLYVKFALDAASFLRDFKEAAEHNDFLIVDTLFKVLDVEDSNNYAQMTQAVSLLTQVAKQSGCHILFVHHNNKSSGMADSSLGMLGSTAIAGSTECNIMLGMDKNGTRKISSENRIPDYLGGKVFRGETLCVDRSSGAFYLTNPVTREQRKMLKGLSVLKVISDALWDNPKGVGVHKLREQVRTIHGKVDNTLVDEMLKFGYAREFFKAGEGNTGSTIHPKWIADRCSYDEAFKRLVEESEESPDCREEGC